MRMIYLTVGKVGDGNSKWVHGRIEYLETVEQIAKTGRPWKLLV